MRLVTGKSVAVPGVTIGNDATDSLFDSDAVHKIMDRYNEFMKKIRESEYEDKIVKASIIKSSQSNNVRYTEGDEVFFQQIDKKAWLYPAKIFCQKGREVFLFANGNLKKIASFKHQ